MKKILISLGAVATLIAPLATVVACGNGSKKIEVGGGQTPNDNTVDISGSAFADFLIGKNLTLITDADIASHKYSVGGDEDLDKAKFLASLTQDENQVIGDHPASFGDDNFSMFASLISLGILSDGQSLRLLSHAVYDKADDEMRPIVLSDDVNNPGKYVLTLQYGNYIRQMSLTKVKDVYTTIPSTIFETDYIPFINQIVEKFTDIFSDQGNLNTLKFLGSMSSAGQIVDPMLIDQIEYIVSKKDALSTVDFNKFNNGSIHWLAIKAFFKGLDSSFIQDRYRMATLAFPSGSSVWDSAHKSAQMLGLGDLGKDFDALNEVQNWAHYASWKPTGAYLSILRFRADKLIDDNFIKDPSNFLSTDLAAVNPTDIKAVIDEVDKTPNTTAGAAAAPSSLAYSTTDLYKDALAINDDAVWVKGVAYASISSTVSFIRVIAEELGYFSK